jgi:hypothetical protein
MTLDNRNRTPRPAMNAYQKAVLLISLVALPLCLLFMQGMAYRGTGIAAVAGLGASAALVYALRTPGRDPGPSHKLRGDER